MADKKQQIENKRYQEEEVDDRRERVEENNKSLASRIFELEDHCADSYLSGELREIYKKIQEDNADFRKNIFEKNINAIESNLGTFSKKNEKNEISIKEKEKRFEEILKDIKNRAIHKFFSSPCFI